MKRIIPVIILLLSVALLITGCDNIFSDNHSTVTTTATTTNTTVQGNSQLVTLAEETTTQSAKKKHTYYSSNIGASFSIPLKWENKYAVEDSVSEDGSKYLSFFEKVNHSNNGKGLIFTFNLFINDDYKKGDSFTEYGTVLTSEDVTYYVVCTTPKDIQYGEKSKGLKRAYNALNKEKYIQYICNSVKFDGTTTLDREGCSTEPSSTAPVITDEYGNTITQTASSTAGNATATAESKPNTQNTGVSGLVFPHISTRKLTDSEVKSLSSDKLQQAINDICAINGYNFQTPSIKAHYQQFSWYKPDPNYSESNFNTTEKYNYSLLQKYR